MLSLLVELDIKDDIVNTFMATRKRKDKALTCVLILYIVIYVSFKHIC